MGTAQQPLSSPLVSIVMPAYNQAQYITESIESVLAQTYQDWELIIVDDGSPDRVASVVKPFVDNDDRIHFYHTANHGVSAARNFAVNHSSGEFILPLDADDKIRPEYIEKAIRVFKEEPGVDVVYCKWEFFGSEKGSPELSYKGYKDLLISNSIFCSALYRRRDYNRVEGYDEKMLCGFEDWEFWIRMLNEKSEIRQIDEILFQYRRSYASRSANAEKPERERQCLRYIYEKNKSIYDSASTDLLNDMRDLAFLRKRVDKWKRRSVFSRLWYALIGKI